MRHAGLFLFSLFFAIILIVTILLQKNAYLSDVPGRVVDEDGMPIVGAIVTLEYLRSYKFRLPLEESTGFGWAWRAVVETNEEGYYDIPVMPSKTVPSWRYRVTVSPEVYIAPAKVQPSEKEGTLDVMEENPEASRGSTARYREHPNPIVVTAKTIDLYNEEQLKARFSYLGAVFRAAPNPERDSHHIPYRWSDADVLKKAMYKEMKLLCGHWKSEYHPTAWQGKRTELPLICQRVLGVHELY